MNYLFLIIICLIVAIISFLIGRKFAIVIKPTSEEIIQYTIDNVKFVNELNPIVKDIYVLFINSNVNSEFEQLTYNLRVRNLNVEVWTANGADAIYFTLLPPDICAKYNKTEKELKILSLADKTILNRISNAIKVNNAEFVSRLFI